MTRKLMLILTVLGGVVAVVMILLISSPGITAQEEVGPKPTFIPPEALTPAPTPEDGRQVAILMLAVSGEGEDLRGIQLERGQIVNSYAPNVAGRPGEWTVEVTGEGNLRFGISDPRRLHVYGETDNREQAHMSEVTGNIRFELVVPLWDQDRDLGAKEIRIFDQQGNEIFMTEVDRENWQRQE